jgi:2-hydroxy-6-oxonona-2,4-dienedioate hydrolase
MNNHLRIARIDQNNPRVQAFARAEQRLFEHYGLDFKTRYVELSQPNIRVRVLEVGSGEPILIAPGGSGEAFVWVPFMAQLKNYRFILFDRPGGGLSDFVDPRQIDLRDISVSTLSAVLDSSSIKSAPIVCNSMGGLWSFWLALDQPARVSKMAQVGCTALILNSSAPLPMRLLSVPVINRRVVALSVPKTMDTAANGLRIIGSSPEHISALPREFSDTFYYSRYLPAYQDSWRMLQEVVLTLGGTKQKLRLKEDELKRVQQPTLFIWGDNDPFGGVEIGKRAASIMPNAKFIHVHAGHLPYVDQPAESARLVREFL